MNKSLLTLTEFQTMLDRAVSVIEAIELKSLADAAQAFYAARGLYEAAQQAKIASIMAARKAGQFLLEMPKNPGARGQIQANLAGDDIVSSPDAPPTYSEIGITAKQAERWQLLAQIPEEDFHRYVDEKVASGYEVTIGGLLAIAKTLRKREDSDAQELDLYELVRRRIAMIFRDLDADEAREYLLKCWEDYKESSEKSRIMIE
jgi:hypothetical protein